MGNNNGKIIIGILIISAIAMIPVQTQSTYQVSTNQIGTAKTQASFPHDMVVVNNFGYIADGRGGMSIVDLSFSTPQQSSFLELSDEMIAIEVENDVTYVLGNSIIHMIDISTPSSPVLLNSFNLVHTYSYDLDVSGNILATDEMLYDISDAQAPTELSSIPVSGIISYEIQSNILHISNSTHYLLFDIVDPTNPTLLDAYYTKDYTADIEIDGDYSYMDVQTQGMFIFDISTPNAISVAGVYNNTNILAVEIEKGTNRAHLGLSGRTYEEVDVSTKSSPTKVNEFTSSESITEVVVHSDNVYLLEQEDGIEVLDSTTDSPSLSSTYDQHSNYMTESIRKSNVLYTLSQYDGLISFSLSDPANPTKLDNYKINDAYDLDISNQLAYIASRTGINILNISNPQSISQVSTYGLSSIKDIEIQGPFMYYTANDDFYVVNITDPYNPSLISATQIDTGIDYIEVDQSIAYLHNYDTLFSLDISNVTEPQVMDTISIASSTNDLVIANSYAYVAYYSEFIIYDLSNPSNLNSIYQSSTDFSLNGLSAISVLGDILYVVEENYGVTFLDISDLSNPTVQDTFDPGSGPSLNIQVGPEYTILDRGHFGSTLYTTDIIQVTETETLTETVTETQTETQTETEINTETQTNTETNTETATTTETQTNTETETNTSVSTVYDTTTVVNESTITESYLDTVTETESGSNTTVTETLSEEAGYVPYIFSVTLIVIPLILKRKRQSE